MQAAPQFSVSLTSQLYYITEHEYLKGNAVLIPLLVEIEKLHWLIQKSFPMLSLLTKLIFSVLQV